MDETALGTTTRAHRTPAAQDKKDDGGAVLAIGAIGAAGVGAWWWLHRNSNVAPSLCPAGQILAADGKTCVPGNTPPAGTPPAGYPVNWCSYTPQQKAISMLVHLMTDTWITLPNGSYNPQLDSVYSAGGLAAVAAYVAAGPAFQGDVVETVHVGGLGSNNPSWWAAATYPDRLLGISSWFIQLAWPGGPGSPGWAGQVAAINAGDWAGACQPFYTSSRFASIVNSAVASAVCTY